MVCGATAGPPAAGRLRVCYVCGEHEFRARSSQSAIGQMGTRLENFNKNAWQQDSRVQQQLLPLLFPLEERQERHASNRRIIDASLIAHGAGIFLIESTISAQAKQRLSSERHWPMDERRKYILYITTHA
jgi:hypothetical protein